MHTLDVDVLGLLFGSYANGAIAIRQILHDGECFVASEAGFTLPLNEQYISMEVSELRFKLLTQVWKELIVERLVLINRREESHADRSQ